MHSGALTSRRLIVAAASLLTVLSVVSLDIAAGTGPTHTTGLAALAVVVSAARIALAGRHRGLFGTVSAALVAQPAVHTLEEGLDPTAAHAAAPNLGLGPAADVVTTATHLVLAGLVVVGIGTAEWLLELVALSVGRVLRILLLVLRGIPRRFVAGLTVRATHRPGPTGGIWIDFPARRGPPHRMLFMPVSPSLRHL